MEGSGKVECELSGVVWCGVVWCSVVCVCVRRSGEGGEEVGREKGLRATFRPKRGFSTFDSHSYAISPQNNNYTNVKREQK